MMDVLSLVPCRNKIRLKKKSSFWYILQLGKVEKKKEKKTFQDVMFWNERTETGSVSKSRGKKENILIRA